jgi:hypothetical protein
MATIAPAPPAPTRSIPRPADATVWRAKQVGWCAACLVCGGLLGLLLAIIGAVRGSRPPRRRVLLVLVCAGAQLVCAGYFAAVSVSAQPAACPTARPGTTSGVWRTARTILDAPVSGAAMLYAGIAGGQPCHVTSEGITVTAVPSGYARGGTMYGTVFLTDRTSRRASARIARLSEHEARHASQWAVFTLLAGPAAFPAVYAADESLFPGAHNHFEQHAGLANGGYREPPDEPPAAGRLLFLIIGLIIGYGAASRRPLRRRREVSG